ncbi:MAG: Fe-S cluster assembly protein SufD [Bacteroidota bacterium]|nr:Fe-S cluster assembly protein SufD [Bacteroidota bacterium]MDP3143996.1 Fe-S cluster assembly protein SufD [Bacteroidota bacterium]MDP3557506.1 Fe-S cluster assembly protein SufD [Bacteroidota bacterium]
MIAEKTNTAQVIIDKISSTSSKVNFIDNDKLSKALLYLENKGIPTNKHEEYKYCNVDGIFKKEFKNIEQKLNSVTDINKYKLNNALTIVVVNGNYSEKLSDKLILKGLHLNAFSNLDNDGKNLIGTLANVESDAFVALNTAFCGDGFHLKIADNEQLQMPIHILYVSSASAESLVNPRNIIELGKNSEATIIEEQINIGDSKVFTNFLSEKFIGENAKLNSYTFQNEGNNGYSVNTNNITLGRYAKYDNTTITLSGTLVRNNHQVVLAAQNCEAHLNGFFSTKSNQLVDNHTLMDHQMPNCESNELYKGIVNDKSTGVFNGKIFVRRDAQKTNAYQSSKNILLSDDATINTKPQLEIYADDVKCSHGTSTGKIDEAAVFYLNARGIGRESAKKLLLNAFAQEVINKIEVEELKEKILNLFENEL